MGRFLKFISLKDLNIYIKLTKYGHAPYSIVMKLYHGSTTLFDRPSNARFKEGFANSEYGVGFNTSDYMGEAWEHADGVTNGPGVIYEFEFDEARLANWLVFTRPIGDAIHGRIMDNLHRLPAERAQSLRETLTPETDGFDAFGILQGRHKNDCQFMMNCGIEGSNTGSIYVFFSAESVPPQKIRQVVGNFPAATEALERQNATGVLSVDKPVKADGTIMGPRKSYMSEELANAAHYIHRTGDIKLAQQFESMASILLSDEWKKPGGNGFDIRNNMGLAFQRLMRDGGRDLSDHFSGANTFTRNVEWMKRETGTADIIAHAETIATAIKAHVQRTRPPTPQA